MRRRHPPIPAIWLMTDERMGNDLWLALSRLPRGAGIVFRHYGLAPEVRRNVLQNVAAIARRRGLVLIVAGETHGTRYAGTHNRRGAGLKTAAAHTRREAIAAVQGGANAIFVSPIFATRSHPGARALGPVRFGLIARGLGVPVIALGGMTAKRAHRLRALGAHGWAAIDAWL